MVKKVPTTYLDVVIALETTYMEAEQWFENTQRRQCDCVANQQTGSGMDKQHTSLIRWHMGIV